MKKLIQQNKGYFAIGITAIAGAYLLFKYRKNKIKAAKIAQYRSLVQGVEWVYQQNMAELTPEVIIQIHTTTVCLAAEQLAHLKSMGRRHRRANLHNSKVYEEIVANMEFQCEEVMDRHLKAILTKLHIDYHEWVAESRKYRFSSSAAKMQWEQASICEQQKGDKDKRRKMSKEQVKQILEDKISKLALIDEKKFGGGHRQRVIGCYIDDLVFRDYQVEAEDLEGMIKGQEEFTELNELYLEGLRKLKGT